jgi:uncharacterized RDD family membrane protein YckC
MLNMEKTSNEYEYVGFGVRLLASIMDYGWLLIMAKIISRLFFGNLLDVEEATKFLFALVVFAIWFTYCLLLWSKKQATIGKMAIHAKIIDAKTGGKPSTRQFVGRCFAMCLSGIVFCLGFLWIAFDKRKRGWHDMLAGTLVVKQKVS